jgi:hypothetical protein
MVGVIGGGGKGEKKRRRRRWSRHVGDRLISRHFLVQYNYLNLYVAAK